jgi:transposase-like protein
MRKSSKSKGKRYSEKERAAILAHVDKINAMKGRGGITAAAGKYGVTPLTISNWMKKMGSTAGAAKRRPSGEFSETLRRLADLHEAIAAKETELTQLRREYSSLKKKL